MQRTLNFQQKKRDRVLLQRTKTKSQQGFVLMVAVVMAALASAAALSLFHRVNAEAETTAQMISRRRAFYAAEGAGAAVMQLVRTYMNANMENINQGDDLTTPITTSITSQGLSLSTLIPGYSIEDFTVLATAKAAPGPVASGPFQGMNANQLPIQMQLSARSLRDGSVSRVNVSSTVGTIGLFNFFVFSDGYLDAINTAPMVIRGRVHSNADFCGSGTLSIENLTAAGRIFAESSDCRYNSGLGNFNVLRKGTNTWNTVDPNHDHCDGHNCVEGSMDWDDYALSMWSGNLADVANNVLPLRLPVSGYAQVLAGRDASGNVKTNINSLKLLVEPPWPGDSSAALEQKYAMIADIRIIDGVWYKNNGSWPGQPIWSDHPGHFVQNASNSNGVINATISNAGQQDIYSGAVPHRYSYYEYIGGTIDNNDTNGVISYGMLYRDPNSSQPVWRPGFMIHRKGQDSDYCALDSSGDQYEYKDYAVVDATRLAAPYKQSYSNSNPNSVSYVSDWDGCHYCSHDDDGDGDCSESDDSRALYGRGANYLNATRMGFEDYRIRNNNGTIDHKLGRILPVNFDLREFEQAMNDTSAGELGSYFNGGADFNGVVWIGSTWPGMGNNRAALDGGGLPNLWPKLGQDAPVPMTDKNQPDHFTEKNNDRDKFSTNDAQTALPFALCSQRNSLGYEITAVTCTPSFRENWTTWSGVPPRPDYHHKDHNQDMSFASNKSQLAPSFVVPTCDTRNVSVTQLPPVPEHGGTISNIGSCPSSINERIAHQLARPNAVRIINGRYIRKSVFTRGLTIATMLPAYVLGDMNKSYQDSASSTDCANYPAASTSSCDETQWLPLQIAADGVTFLSNSWRDDRARWGTSTPTSDGDYSNARNRPKASDTEYWLAVVAGLVTTSSRAGSGGIHNFPRFLENWFDRPRATTRIEGALILGYKSSYARQRFSPPSERGVYHPPTRLWGYDEHFRQLANQPPGSPTFTVNAVKTWRRDSDY